MIRKGRWLTKKAVLKSRQMFMCNIVVLRTIRISLANPKRIPSKCVLSTQMDVPYELLMPNACSSSALFWFTFV